MNIRALNATKLGHWYSTGWVLSVRCWQYTRRAKVYVCLFLLQLQYTYITLFWWMLCIMWTRLSQIWHSFNSIRYKCTGRNRKSH